MLVKKTEFNKTLILVCFSIAYDDLGRKNILLRVTADPTAISAQFLLFQISEILYSKNNLKIDLCYNNNSNNNIKL